MRIHVTQPLFAWSELEDSPSLKAISELLARIPDTALLEALVHARGRGRDDYPVRVLWGVLVLTAALRHPGVEACLAELRRNRGLRELIGIESEHAVPRKWNMSRFLNTLGDPAYLPLLMDVFKEMLRRLGAAVPDLGQHTAGDACNLNGRPKHGAEQAKEVAQGFQQPCGGRKEYTGDDGRVTRVVKWFGYKLHLLVDVKHEVVLSCRITNAHGEDAEQFLVNLDQARANLPQDRIQTAAFDKAADCEKVHSRLHAQGVKPLVENRRLWQDEHERQLPGHPPDSNIVHDEHGTVHCYDMQSCPPVRRQMAYIGHEAKRGTLKYRCPARHQGWSCPSDAVCNAGKRYGKTVRIKQEHDLRRFPPIPRATKQFERLYKGRTAAERVIARLKLFWGADDGNITGARRFHAYIGVVMLVHAAFATMLAAAPRHNGVLGITKLGPVQQALQQAS
jgi:hypothetical protein